MTGKKEKVKFPVQKIVKVLLKKRKRQWKLYKNYVESLAYMEGLIERIQGN